MEDRKDTETLDEAEMAESRRRFLKRAGLTAATAPAVAVPMAAGPKRAAALDDSPVSGLKRYWVGRAVYGADDPRWLLFRSWMLVDAPSWFRRGYLCHGAAVADWLADKAVLKRVIRAWMDGRIAARA
ncbi:MAG: hypothetical protein H6907_18770 [Hyphomicrobiales bacterium]|nr:hypothetical protein [Hyphomicrobiales bacterium]MCP5373778.1 hypothetical protein [Hyphomicrobiales bacterium]